MTDPPVETPEPEAAVPGQSASVPGRAGHEPILRNAAWCVAAAAGATLVYALQVESPLFRAAALQLCLCGTALWAAIDAAKIRRRLRGVAGGPEELPIKREAAALHYVCVASLLTAVLVFTGLSMLGQLVSIAIPRPQPEVVGGAILSVLAASLWTVFARVVGQRYEGVPGDEQPTPHGAAARGEGAAVRAALSESRLTALLAGGTLLAATVYPPIEGWFAWALSLWTVAVAGEHLIRLFVAWFKTTSLDREFTTPIGSILREVFLTTANPVGKAFDICEARFGLSLRSSWTIGFFRRSVTPIAAGCLLVVWASTCFVVIQPHQAGLEYRLGVAQKTRLAPGLHAKLPWPLGEIRRFPAGIVQTMQIGFEEDAGGAPVAQDADRTLLWTQPHAQEFALVLGSETELVAINAIVYFKIAEDTRGFLDHALASSNPEVALESLAYRVLMEQTRTATLKQLLSSGRDRFAAEVRERLSEYSAAERLGLDVVDVALINLHPPVEVAGSYLDVISAGLDSDRVVTVASGDAAKQTLEAQQNSNGRLADATAEAARRVSVAGQESAEFLAVGEAYAEDPETYRLRLWFEAFEQVLAGRRLMILDSQLPDVIFDERPRTADPVLAEPNPPRSP
ncbi:MAG: SPFH domain-containing protein [Planctomycetota bacterium]